MLFSGRGLTQIAADEKVIVSGPSPGFLPRCGWPSVFCRTPTTPVHYLQFHRGRYTKAETVLACRDLDKAGTAARWERHGIGARELAMHLLDTSAGVKSPTGNLSDYKRRMALAIRIIVMGVKKVETCR
jgi:hypothetical protein